MGDRVQIPQVGRVGEDYGAQFLPVDSAVCGEHVPAERGEDVLVSRCTGLIHLVPGQVSAKDHRAQFGEDFCDGRFAGADAAGEADYIHVDVIG